MYTETGYSDWNFSIELTWSWITPPGEKKMGVFIMICTDVMGKETELKSTDSVLLTVFKPSMN
jgi:hypothetical protein